MANLKMPEYYRQEMIKFYEEKIQELEESKRYFLQELKKLKGESQEKTTTQKLENQGLFSNGETLVTAGNGYNKSWDWTRKIEFIFSREQKILKASEVVNNIIEFEPELVGSTDDKDFPRKSIAATLSRRSKEEGAIFVKYLMDNKTFYGLSDWFEAHGMLKDEYKP